MVVVYLQANSSEGKAVESFFLLRDSGNLETQESSVSSVAK
jgi:hypothetical protein